MGYYGFGNAGDEVMLEVLRDFLAPHRVIAFPTGFLPSSEAIRRLNAFGFLIVGGGELYKGRPPRPFDTFDEWMGRLETPIGVLGVGVEKLDACQVPTTHKLVDRALFFVVRNEESKRLIGHPCVQVAPDLTFYKPLRVNASQKLGEGTIVCGVNLRPRRRGVSEWVRAVSGLPCLKRAVPLSVVPAFDDREPLSAVDPICPSQFRLTAYESLDIMIGTAFHSIVFAVQNGIPAIAINYHAKVRRLMEDIGLGEYVLEWSEWDQLRVRYDQVLMNRASIREQMLEHTARAHGELLRILQDVRQRIDVLEVANPGVTLSISYEPKVSIIVQCEDAAESAVTKTVQSCLDQTHHNLEVILIVDAQQLDGVAKALQDNHHVRLVDLGKNSTDWAIAALGFVSGDYITWLQAGAWYADDAISLLVKLMEERPATDLAYADFFLANNGIIERKIETYNSRTPGEFTSYGPCFLVRRDKGLEVWGLQINSDNVCKRIECWGERVLHIPHALLFTPASESEIYLYRSAIAYGRGQTEKAKQFLARASGSDPTLIDSAQAKEKVFEFYWNRPFEIILESDPPSYMETICDNLPTDTHELRVFKKWFVARASIAEAFMLRERGQMREVRCLLLRSIWYDARWLLNRGVLSVLAETLFGRSTLHVYRQTKQRMKEMLSKLAVQWR